MLRDYYRVSDKNHKEETLSEENYDLELQSISKSFGEAIAVDCLSLALRPGEFISLLGPSGCGKTTTLSMIAGFQTVSNGQINIRGKRVDSLPPEMRNTGMVFQNYALFPHLSVVENVKFGLRMRKVPRKEAEERSLQALRTVRMENFVSRRPSELSGGQQQRVALARALVTEPALLLLDEPFGALDRQLREQLQLEVKSLHRRLRVSTLLVTHDQEEALSLSDRVAVMNNGKIEQIASPADIYAKPRTEFVAKFIGKGSIFPTKVIGREKDGVILECVLGRITVKDETNTISIGESVQCFIRPEAFRVSADLKAKTENEARGKVSENTYQGSMSELHVDVGESMRFIVSERSDQGIRANVGDTVRISFLASEALLFKNGILANI